MDTANSLFNLKHTQVWFKLSTNYLECGQYYKTEFQNNTDQSHTNYFPKEHTKNRNYLIKSSNHSNNFMLVP